jgi:predicted transglutaminase-like cysteine proteinase
MRVIIVLVSLIVLAGASGPSPLRAEPIATESPKAGQHAQGPQDRSQPYMRVFGVTAPPYAFVSFCERLPNECADAPTEAQRVQGTDAQIAELDQVNRHVNKVIEPATDMELYGVIDYWTIPKTRGDCEDYALLKRQILIRAGWPASALLMTVVLDENKEGHAILTARTARGDFLLDNKTDELKLWNKSTYVFVMRQSYLHARVWMSLDPKQATPAVPVATPRQR